MQLTRKVNTLLRNVYTMSLSSNCSEFSILTKDIDMMKKRLTQPLRVAVVGFMKAGKSTLMNAIMGKKILYTGFVETTYTVTWFKYGEKPKLKIVLKNGKSIEAPFCDLEKWTVRDYVKTNPEINNVKYVIIYYPSEILKTMELIDTPGLFATYGTDSKNSLDFLGLSQSSESHKITAEEAAEADAIIYAFSRGVQGNDAEIMDALKGDHTSNSSPINALGVFTKADVYWDCARYPEKAPFQVIGAALEGYKANLKDKLYNILPVIAKPVEAISDMDDNTFSILQNLSSLDTKILLEFLADANLFITEPMDEDMPVPTKDRKHVLDCFGQYGIYLITEAIKNNVTKEDLYQYLYNASGIEKATNLICQHFGNRAYLIKVDYVLRRLRSTTMKIKHNNGDNNHIVRICNRIVEDIDQLRDEEQAFKELKILQDYYNEDIIFNDKKDEKEFLQILGEYGSDCEAKLGFHSVESIKTLKRKALEKSNHWNALTNDFGVSKGVDKAAEVIVRSCDNMYYYLDMLSGYDKD